MYSLFFKEIELLLKKLFSTVEFDPWWINIGLVLPRIAFGLILISEAWRVKIGMPVNEFQSLMPADLTLPEWLNWINEDTLRWFGRLENSGRYDGKRVQHQVTLSFIALDSFGPVILFCRD